MERSDDDLRVDDLDAIRLSPRATDRLSWHLVECRTCDADWQRYCPRGEHLVGEAEAVARAIGAYLALPAEQRRILLDDWRKAADEEALKG